MARMISRQEAAQMLEMTEQSVSNWMDRGLLSGHKMGRALMLDRNTIVSHFDSLTEIAAMEHSIEELSKELKKKEKALHDTVRAITSDLSLVDYHGAPCLLKPVLGAILEVAKADVLTDREYTFLSKALEDGKWGLDCLTRDYGLTRARVLQICHKALNKIACMGNYNELRLEKRRLEKENGFLTSGMKSLQRRVEELKKQLMIDNNRSMLETYEEDPGSLTHLMNTKMVDFNLTVRCLNILRQEGVETLGEVVAMRKTDLLKFRNMGRKSLAELEDLLESLDLSFGMDVDKAVKDDMCRWMEVKSKKEGAV